MMILIIGSPDSGKSVLAESLALQLAPAGRKIYIATMIPYGEEGRARVRKHRGMREGKGFETIECPRDLTTLTGLSGAVCLLECMSNLVGNEMHAEVNRGKTAEDLCRLICDEIAYLKENTENLIVVSNEFACGDDSCGDDSYGDDSCGNDSCGEDFYDEETRAYIALTHRVNLRLKDLADHIYIKEKEEWIHEKAI